MVEIEKIDEDEAIKKIENEISFISTNATNMIHQLKSHRQSKE